MGINDDVVLKMELEKANEKLKGGLRVLEHFYLYEMRVWNALLHQLDVVKKQRVAYTATVPDTF